MSNGLAAPLRADAARNRERVIAAALEVFNDEGIDTGVDRIALRAGVGVGTLYRRFPTKDALIAYLVADLLATLNGMASKNLERTDGRGLEMFSRGMAEHLARYRGCLSRMWDTRHPKQGEVHRHRIEQLLRAAQAARTVRDDVVLVDVLSVLWALRGIIESADVDAVAACHRHLDIVFTGLRPAYAPLR